MKKFFCAQSDLAGFSKYEDDFILGVLYEMGRMARPPFSNNPSSLWP
jgi:hypothetical protein